MSARSHQFIFKRRVSLPKQPVNEHEALTGHIPVMRFAYPFCQAVHTRVHIAARVGGEVQYLVCIFVIEVVVVAGGLDERNIKIGCFCPTYFCNADAGLVLERSNRLSNFPRCHRLHRRKMKIISRAN